ncbi:Tagatose-6-phosphate kinase [Baekduia alba]|uniref:1-phosphofructokinase family hexose kinase n=1 Tax=Baekduia alba TaxID=2997333 RepID=UPI002341E16A|nr:PfkB family carbohydrate kinase [Baekduia alba]WCB94812.1 Tagatose-6-phosphate kinase [Baekduia alba]
MIVCAAPNPSIDKLFIVDAVSVGSIHRPDRLISRAGGKGLNVARAAHALGADVVAVALLAGHAGRWIADELVEAGVKTETVWAEGESRSSLSVAAGGAMTEFYERGTPPGPVSWDAFVASVRAVARDGATWLSISGSMPPHVPAEEAVRLVASGREVGARVAVDQHDRALAAALTAGPDLVKVNRHEAADLTGHADPQRAAAALREQAVAGGADPATALTVVTLGEEGALMLLPDGSTVHGDLDVRAPYPTGSGDSFLAGLLAADDAGAAPADALAVALGAATANAEAEGAGTFDAGRARALAERARGRVVVTA